MNMQTPPLKLTLVIVFLIGCVVVLGYSLKQSGLAEGWFAPKTPLAGVSQIVAHMPDDRREAAKKVTGQALREYDTRNAKGAPGYKEGREAVQLYAGYAVAGDVHGEGVLQRAAFAARGAKLDGMKDPLVDAAADAMEYHFGRSYTPKDLREHLERVEALRASSYPAECLMPAVVAAMNDLRRYDLRSQQDFAGYVAEQREAMTDVGLDTLRALGTNEVAPGYLLEEADVFTDQFRTEGEIAAMAPRVEDVFKEAGAGEADRALMRSKLLLMEAMAPYREGRGDSLSQEQKVEIGKKMGEARKLLERTAADYPEDPRAAARLITISGGRGQQERRDGYFQQAVKADAKYYDAYRNRMMALRGADAEIAAFGEECVKTGYWETRVPMVQAEGLVMMARNQKDVLARDDVWKPISSTYRKYLSKYPGSLRARTQYLSLAVRAEKWKEAQEQAAILGENWDQTYLGEGGYRRLQERVAASRR